MYAARGNTYLLHRNLGEFKNILLIRTTGINYLKITRAYKLTRKCPFSGFNAHLIRALINTFTVYIHNILRIKYLFKFLETSRHCLSVDIVGHLQHNIFEQIASDIRSLPLCGGFFLHDNANSNHQPCINKRLHLDIVGVSAKAPVGEIL